MKKLDLQTETNLLLAKQIIDGYSNGSDIIDWTLLLIKNGYSSENLYILAGLEDNDSWNIDNYFKKVIDDLNIDSNINKKDLLDFYLIYHIKASINNPLILDETIYLLTEVIYNTSYYLSKHLNFFFLYDELEELTGIKREEYALSKFKAFIDELESK
uniref:hypothetical protein n=1 Tax=uncultured Dysgonomonas sp. TaxID=206096 RepID=UPI00262BF3AE|nr:hypothetical protein [uncultured Dysgonomonas sp.]